MEKTAIQPTENTDLSVTHYTALESSFRVLVTLCVHQVSVVFMTKTLHSYRASKQCVDLLDAESL